MQGKENFLFITYEELQEVITPHSTAAQEPPTPPLLTAPAALPGRPARLPEAPGARGNSGEPNRAPELASRRGTVDKRIK